MRFGRLKSIMIRTVRKDIRPEALGWCQCHEHLLIADGPSRRINAALYMADPIKSLAETVLYRQAGGVNLVDSQPYGCGRMAGQLAHISAQTGVNIISCTGFHKVEFFEKPALLEKLTSEQLADIYTREVTNGMADADGSATDAKAGIIKCAAVKGGVHADRRYGKLF